MKRAFDTSSLSLHKFSPRLYCFVSTRSQSVISKLRGLKDEHIRFAEVDTPSEYKTFVLSNPASSRENIISSTIINDQGDYDLPRMVEKLLAGGFVDDYRGDSLVSVSCANDRRFACMTDFWGIMAHCYHRSEDTFACGSSIFMIANIVSGEISRESLYDCLFFSWPRRERTWFRNIQRLLPGQQLIFDLRSRAVSLSGTTNFPELLEPAKRDLIESVEGYFSRANVAIGPNRINYVALSAGSDSRTVLACLRAFHMRPHAVSFGRQDMLETKDVAKLAYGLRVPWLFIDLEGFEEKFEDLFVEGAFFSNGLLNPYRTHYVWMYNHLRRGNALFEGILGSEFVKGEIAVPAMAAHPYHDVIARKGSAAESIASHYPQLPEQCRRAMAEYIEDTYGSELLDVNTEEGERAFQRYLLGDIPSKVFAGVISIVLANSLHPYYPFLSPSILGAVFDSGAGIRRSVSVRKDFVGFIASLKAEAMIVRHLDTEIFNSMLDRNVSFREVFSAPRIAGAQRRIRKQRRRIVHGKMRRGQIDVTRLVVKLRDHVKDLDNEILPIERSDIVANDLLARAYINYSWIQDLAQTILF